MPTTTRLGMSLLAVGGEQKETLLNSALNTLDNAALVTIANTFARTPDATTQHGNISIGDGGFTGGAGHYAGGAGGSLLAINLVSGGTADLANLQINGVSKWKLGSGGNVTLGDGSNMVFGTATGTSLGSAASQKVSVYGVTPVAQQAGTTELRAGLIAFGIFNSTGAQDHNLNGGNLTAGAGAFSGAIGGSGTPVTLKRFSLTFPSDADYTLAVGEKDAFYIDVQNATITATRNIIVPGAAGGTYCVINRHATQSVVLKTAANAGITVPALRARIIGFPGGTVAFAITASQDYTT